MLLAAAAALGSCTVQAEPGAVWNLREKIVGLSKSLSGLPYHYGGTDIDGFDCSGFVQYVYDCYGIRIPRTAKKQGRMKNRIRFKEARPGDILIFKIKGGWHSGLLLSRRRFVHAPKRGDRIRQQEFDLFWKRHFKWAVRVIDDQ